MQNTFLRKEEVRVDLQEVRVDFTVLEVGDYVQFYEPHRTFGDEDVLHTAKILSIVDDDNRLVMSSRFLLSRDHHRVRNVVPGVPVDDDIEAPLEVRPHWRIIGSFYLMYGGTHGHATVLCAVANASENASLIRRRIINSFGVNCSGGGQKIKAQHPLHKRCKGEGKRYTIS